MAPRSVVALALVLAAVVLSLLRFGSITPATVVDQIAATVAPAKGENGGSSPSAVSAPQSTETPFAEVLRAFRQQQRLRRAANKNITIVSASYTATPPPPASSFPGAPMHAFDFCAAGVGLPRVTYATHKPRADVVNATGLSFASALDALDAGIRRVWESARGNYTSSNGGGGGANATEQLRQQRRAERFLGCERTFGIAGFGAMHMRPFQLVPWAASMREALSPRTRRCGRAHLFVDNPESPILLHLRALLTPSIAERAYTMSVSELLDAQRSGVFDRRGNDNRDASFLVLESFERALEASRSPKHRRTEVIRVNVLRWWTANAFGGGLYDYLLMTDTRDLAFARDPFVAILAAVYSSSSDDEEDTDDGAAANAKLKEGDDFIVAGLEEFPFANITGEVGLRWNHEVHTTVFTAAFVPVLKQLTLRDTSARGAERFTSHKHYVRRNNTNDNAVTAAAPLTQLLPAFGGFYQLVNSGVYAGTRRAMVDLYDVWAPSIAAVASDTFGIDQPLLGALFYIGFAVAEYPHAARLLSISRGPIRQLYLDGGVLHGRTSRYPFMRFAQRIGSSSNSETSPRVVLVSGGSDDVPSSFLQAAARANDGVDGANETSALPSVVFEPNPLNCDNEPYAIVHQGDRYADAWRRLTGPFVEPTNQWGHANGVQTWFTPKKPKPGRPKRP